jgi:hypothetical protein
LSAGLPIITCALIAVIAGYPEPKVKTHGFSINENSLRDSIATNPNSPLNSTDTTKTANTTKSNSVNHTQISDSENEVK